jgi:hypothetical protein
MNATPVFSVGARVATCIAWGDGGSTERNGGCAQMARLGHASAGADGAAA